MISNGLKLNELTRSIFHIKGIPGNHGEKGETGKDH